MKNIYSERLNLLPPYLFIKIDKKKKELKEKGVDIISFGVGDPDLPTPEHIIKAGQEALTKPEFHQYPFGPGIKEYREAISKWYKNRFNVDLDPDKEVYSLIGSKEGIGHFPLAFVNPGDVVLIPDPGYPVYRSGTIFSGGEPYFMSLIEENDFLPDLGKIPQKILKKSKIMFLNYPNNPTSATAPKEYFKEVVKFAKKNNMIVAHDAAYSEMYYDGNPPDSFLSIEGAKNVGIEFHSLSKTYNMTGWRIGWACGNAGILKGLATVKDNYDSGAFTAIQYAGIVALTGPQECVNKMRETYQKRRDVLVDELIKLGWKLRKPKATFYVWAKVPSGYNSTKTMEKLLMDAGIVTTPGVGMGSSGEGYIRFALTVNEDRIKQAVERIKKIKW